MAAVAPGTAVWFDHPVERWVPATVAEAGSKSLSVTVDLESLGGETREPTEGAPERHTMKAGKGAEEAGLVSAESGAHQRPSVEPLRSNFSVMGTLVKKTLLMTMRW